MMRTHRHALASLLGVGLMLGCQPKSGSPSGETPERPAKLDTTAQEATAEAAPKVAADACIGEQTMPPPDVPWKDVAAFCDQAPRGEKWAQAVPGPGEGAAVSDAYALRVATWLRALSYRQAPYNWLHDARWRLTGDYEGCPPDGHDKGPHPAVRIYYSPEVVDWMCAARRGEDQLPDSDDLPAGSMIIKEMISPAAVNLKRKPGSDELWIAPPADGQEPYDDAFSSWTIMIKVPGASADGWYYAYFDKAPAGNPPLKDRGAFSVDDYPGHDGQPVTTPPDDRWFPTYWQYAVPDVQFANYGFGNYCVYCHASAQGENTFSSISNILGREIEYRWRPTPTAAFDHDDHDRGPPPAAANTEQSRGPFPDPLAAPLPLFASTFTALGTTYQQVWDGRLPAQTWDHAVSMVGVEGVPPEHSTFLTSDQCEGCHEAGGSGQLALPHMVVKDGDAQIDLSPWAEWSVSPMGLAGRDPIFHAQLELERNIASTQPGLADIKDCIDNTCLHCHGAPGARQYNIDTAGQGPADDPCKDFLPQKPERRATDYDGKLFTQEMVFAWRDEDPEHARYGGLARDGINCTICHRMADTDLDPANLKKTFTGNYRVGPADVLYGPFPNDDSKAAVLTAPMENALAIEPAYGAQIATSDMCGTCHTVFLPVFDEAGELAGTSYEQTTYLEWLLSDFSQPGTEQSCQDCHMQSRYKDQHPLKTGIANVQDTRYPEADFLLPAAQVDNPERPYRRHQLYGLNAFLNAFVQQFPLILGYRQQNYMNGNVRAALLNGRETVLEVARKETATVKVEGLAWTGGALRAKVKVDNKSGHSLPSGVGFRRLFIELVVLDAAGRALWASGRTNAMGVLLAGTSQTPLATESGRAGADGLPFQPHHQVIEREDQVQIYEELTQNETLAFTSSFLHRYWMIKDNRLRPWGYDPAKFNPEGMPPAQIEALREEYGKATAPGTGPERHWWPEPAPMTYENPAFPAIAAYRDTAGDPDYDGSAYPGKGLPGTDTLTYVIALSEADRAAAKTVRVTLYSQSIPPQYLEERFAAAARPGAERQAADRLYWMVGHLNTAAKADDGRPYLQDWRLRVGAPATAAVPSR